MGLWETDTPHQLSLSLLFNKKLFELESNNSMLLIKKKKLKLLGKVESGMNESCDIGTHNPL